MPSEDPLLSELIALRTEVQELRNELTDLQNDLKKLHIWSSPSRVEDLWDWVEEIESNVTKTAPVTALPGKKTSARIAKLKAILKARGGAQTFKKLQEDLDMSPSEFTYLVGCLDKRSFEIGRRPGSKRGEKVLSLRVRIMEPVVFK